MAGGLMGLVSSAGGGLMKDFLAEMAEMAEMAKREETLMADLTQEQFDALCLAITDDWLALRKAPDGCKWLKWDEVQGDLTDSLRGMAIYGIARGLKVFTVAVSERFAAADSEIKELLFDPNFDANRRRDVASAVQ